MKLTYFTVVGDFRAVVADKVGDDNHDPDLPAITADVTFTPMVNSGDLIVVTSEDPRPIGYGTTPIAGIIDVDGRLKLRPQPDDGVSEFTPIRLLADTPVLELQNPLFYTVSFSNVKFGDKTGSIKGFTFQAPTADVELNLLTVTRRAGQTAVGALTAGPPGPPGEPGPPGPPGQGEFDPASLEYIDEVDDNTEFVVVDPAVDKSVDGTKVVKLSTWTVLKARLSDWLAGRGGPELPGPGVQADLSFIPEIGRVRLPDPGYNTADILAGVPNPRRNPASFNIIDGRTEFNETGHPFQNNPTPQATVMSFRHDLTPDSDARFILRVRKGGTVLISEDGTDLAAGVSHIVLAPVRGNAYVGTGNQPVANQTLAANQIVTAGNIVSLSNKTLVSPTITGAPIVNGEKVIGEQQINTLIANAVSALPNLTSGLTEAQVNTLIGDAITALTTTLTSTGGGEGLTTEQLELLSAVKFFANQFTTTLANVPEANRPKYQLFTAISDFVNSEFNRVKVITETSVQTLYNKTIQSPTLIGSPVLHPGPPGNSQFGGPISFRTTKVPDAPDSAGIVGQWAADETHFYVYTAETSGSHPKGWKRIAFDTGW